MDLDSPVCPISTAADLASLKVATARFWVLTKRWLYNADRQHNPDGTPRVLRSQDSAARAAGATTLLTGRSVIAMSIAAKLVDAFGLHPGDACWAARDFTDIGGEIEVDGRRISRIPGQLIGEDRTALVVYPVGARDANGQTGVETQVLPLGAVTGQRLVSTPGHLSMRLASIRTEFAILVLDPIVKRVELGIEPLLAQSKGRA